MPGTTPIQGLPFDYLDEVVSSVPQKNFADAVALKLNAKDTQRTTALTRPVAAVSRSSSQAVNVLTATNITWTTEVSDTAGTMVDIATQPTRITCTAAAGAGLYYFEAQTNMSSLGGATALEISVIRSGSSVRARRKIFMNAGLSSWYASVVGQVQLTVGQYLELSVVYSGGSSPQNFTTSNMSVYKISN